MSINIKKLKWKLIDSSPLFIRYPLRFRSAKGHWPRIFFPKDYSDFIARDNYFGRHNKHAYLADKLEVRKYIEKKGLGDILVPLLGYWDDASKINFESLPNQFAIKCNHSCGMNIICFDKTKLNIEATRRTLDSWMHTEHPVYYEQHYRHIKPMIMAEQLIPSNADGCFPPDYKIHCAGGRPIFIQCCIERDEQSTGKRVIYDCNWNKLPYVLNDETYTDEDIERPRFLERMLDIAKILSSDLEYARIDLYETDRSVLFGEITLTPMGGWLSYFTQEALDLMGKEIRKGKDI